MYSAKDMGIRKRIFDPEAWSIEDIMRETAMNAGGARELANDNTESGEWEKVWKRSPKNGRPVPAYRAKKKR